jgi:integrase
VTGYLSALATAGKKPRTVQQALAAIKYGCRELHFAHYLSADQEAEVRQVKPGWGGKQRGAPAGRWLDEHQTREMLLAARRKAAGRTTALVGRRDCALLALMLGCGLRKGEAATVTVGQYQSRDGRPVLLDVRGKHGRVRIVPVPGWAAALLDDWLIVRTTAGITVTADSLLIVGIRVRWKEAKAATAQGLSGGQIWKIVWAYAREAGVEVCPHDLRRTFARLAREGGAAMDQIQMALGHEHSWTTELYVNARVDLKNAACDSVRMTL